MLVCSTEYERVWEFADALCEIEEEMQKVRMRGKDDRKWVLYTYMVL